MKRVSFKTAKAIKEAGYKFIPAPSSFFTNETNSWFDNEDDELYSLPFVLEVWLWLWREKRVNIHILNSEYMIFMRDRTIGGCSVKDDPEEDIIAAIEYLVDNDLIK